jgi:hypothetical protein
MAEADLRLLLRTIADTKGAEQTSAALRRVQQDAKQTDATSQQMVAGLARQAAGFLSVATAASALGSVYSASITAARENERVTRATAAAYGAGAQQFERFAASLSQSTGFTSQAILEAALSARTLSQNYGLTIDQTQKLIRASADLARVRGIGVAEAFERVQSAIRGEAEASEYLGLTLNDTFIKNNALNGSVKTTFERMTDAQKAQIRYGELLKQTATFAGLAASSMNTLDGAMLKSETATNRLNVSLGKLIAPATISGLQKLANAADALDKAMQPGEVVGELLRGGLGNIPALPGRVVAGRRTEATRARDQAIAEELETQRRILAVHDQAAIERERRARAAAEGQATRLRQLNENVPPVTTSAETLRQIAYLDQRDAAVRDLVAAQREELDLKTQLTRMEQQHGAMTQRRLQVELQSIAVQQRALPSQYALQDTERAIERARLVLDVRGTSAAERSAARGTIRDLERNVLPGRRLQAFDAESGMIAAARQAQALDLTARQAAIGQEQAVAGQAALIDAAASRTDAAMSRLEAIVERGMAERGQRPVQITLQVLGPDGQVTYEELIEATDQAQMPPVIRVSGVRR